MTNTKYVKLGASLLIDAVGMLSYALLGLGELTDIVWLFISATLNYLLYRNGWLSGLNALEEGLPFTDIIPTSTINWLWYYRKNKPVKS